jgi:hypothetical protein
MSMRMDREMQHCSVMSGSTNRVSAATPIHEINNNININTTNECARKFWQLFHCAVSSWRHDYVHQTTHHQ